MLVLHLCSWIETNDLFYLDDNLATLRESRMVLKLMSFTGLLILKVLTYMKYTNTCVG